MWWLCHPLFVNCNIPSSNTDFLCNPSFQWHGPLWVLIMLIRSDDRQQLPACHSKFSRRILRQISDWDPVNMAIVKFKYWVDNKTTVFWYIILCKGRNVRKSKTQLVYYILIMLLIKQHVSAYSEAIIRFDKCWL